MCLSCLEDEVWNWWASFKITWGYASPSLSRESSGNIIYNQPVISQPRTALDTIKEKTKIRVDSHKVGGTNTIVRHTK